MSPGNIRKEILKQLRQTRNEMMTAAWIDAAREQPDEVRREAAFKRANIMDAIRELQNAELAEIRDKLVENETVFNQKFPSSPLGISAHMNLGRLYVLKG